MASGRLADYLGKGLASARPATLDLYPEAVGFWYATDTDTLSAWDGAAWHDDLSGGGIPDAPSDGTTYGRKDGSWTEVAGGSPVDRSVVTSLAIVSGVVNIDCSLGDYFTLALTANVTSITFSNLPASGKAMTLAIRFKQDGTGSRTVALPSSLKAVVGSDTAVQAAANAYTNAILTTYDQGTRWEYSMKGIAA